jgi:hypothetical protein
LAEIKFISSPAWLWLIALAALSISLALYYQGRSKNPLNPSQKWILGLIRFGVVFLLGMLLLSPLIKKTDLYTVKPYLLVAVDNSKSLSFAMDSLALETFWDNLQTSLDKLSSKFDIQGFTFGEEVRPFTGQKPSFNEKSTHTSAVYTYLQKHFKSQQPGAVLLATDGIYNKGLNPLYASRNAGIPTYTLGMGDTSIYKDLAIKNVFHNNLAYLQDRIKIQIDLQALKAQSFSSQLSLKKRTAQGWIPLQNTNINIEEDHFFTTLEWEVEAKEPGQLHLRLEWAPLLNELTLANNTRDLYIEVLDNRKKIYLLAHAPHPDVAAFKRALESETGSEVSTVLLGEGNLKPLAEADLVILHQLPSRQYPLRNEMKLLKEKKVPILFVLGSQSDLSALNRAQDGLAIGTHTYRSNDVNVSLNTNFPLFLLEPQVGKKLAQYPPLQAPFGEYSLNPASIPLFYQQIKGIGTQYPLLSFYEELGWKTAVLSGENIWRWRIFNYLEDENFEVFDPLVNNMVRYLSTQEDKRRFKVFLTQNQIDELTSITFGAELYNPNYEPVNAPEVKLKLIDEQKNEFSYLFSRVDPFYRASIGQLPAGNYQYEASTTWNGALLNTTGAFVVKKIEMESTSLTADFQLLHTLAQQTGGKFYPSEEMEQLTEALLQKDLLQPLLKERAKTQPLIHFSALGILLLTLLGLEWFLRKYWGLR